MAIKTIGVLGAGQLGRMLALAGLPLDLRFKFFDPTPGSPASFCAEQIVASFDDEGALERFARSVDVITFEFENVPAKSVMHCAKFCPVHPGAQALQVAQDRLSEKSTCQSLGVPTPRFKAVSSVAELSKACGEVGFPCVLKTRRMGYDGKGQKVIKSASEVATAFAAIGSDSLIVEEFVAFDREVSALLVRSQSGEVGFYPLVENIHRDGILWRSLAPAAASNNLHALARSHAEKIAQHLGYYGVLAVEFFERAGQLLFNEMAPRVHNSGHWTIEGCHTSQFENHIRAVAGLPLGDCGNRGHSVMYNILGTLPARDGILAIPRAHLHLYGKTERPGRKLGHVTVCAPTPEEAHALSLKVEQQLSPRQ